MVTVHSEQNLPSCNVGTILPLDFSDQLKADNAELQETICGFPVFQAALTSES